MENTKVIVRGNNYEQTYSVGTFLRHGLHGLAVVEIGGVEYTCCGIVLPDSPELRGILDAKSNEEQWEWCKALVQGYRKFEQQDH
jgi:hypothetical protein